MILRSISRPGKGWYTGPWDSSVAVGVGYSDIGVDEVHVHAEMFEIYLVARGTSTAEVNGTLHRLAAGDVLIVEPGEVHTVRDSSEDYLHFVIQTPFVPGDKTLVDQPEDADLGRAAEQNAGCGRVDVPLGSREDARHGAGWR